MRAATVAGAVFALACALLLPGPAGAGSVAQVKMGKRQYRPRVVEIDAGTSVRWRNTSTKPHTVISNDQLFNSGVLLSGDRYRRRFGDPGVYRYHCTIHDGMRGTVRVVGKT